ncbi:hypothetical protein ABT340_36185 [Streptosporangium sp. NPDC000239]|uniref:hypothetical protein n=1 Tax=Streptosporangium sp. NPDC000239 TaxID=3154248 RepID=UPI003317F561
MTPGEGGRALPGSLYQRRPRLGEDGGRLEVAFLSEGPSPSATPKPPDQTPYVVRADVWDAFIHGAENGEFDF